VDEVRLVGGFVSEVVRVGQTVRRVPGERAGFVHEVLRLLDGWGGAPKYLGTDERGREVLSFVDGYVAWEEPREPAIYSAAALQSVGRLVREFHDLTAGTASAGEQEVVCHNDLSPKNTVYTEDGTEAIAFIDWDIAAPGRRIHDVAFSCWQYAELGDVARVRRQWAALLDGYGPIDTADLLDTILWWQTRTADGIEDGAAHGDPSMQHLIDRNIPATIREARAWISTNANALGISG
jgi:Phosphotransferase enzyme family